MIRTCRLPLLGSALLLSVFAGGCNPDCQDPGRINGEYAVFSNATSEAWTSTSTLTDLEDQSALLGGLFANGDSAWTLQYVPSSSSYAVIIDDQRFVGEPTSSEGSCNLVQLDLGGVYTSAVGSVHTFTWSGELLWSGERLDGTFSYADTWTWEDDSGAVDIPDGQLQGERSGG